MKYLLLLCLVSYSTAYVCCPPKQWESLLFQAGGYYLTSGQLGMIDIASAVHSDLKSQLVAAEQRVRQGGVTVDVKIIQDFGEHIQYAIQDGLCSKTALPGAMEDTACIPDDAENLGNLNYGLDSLDGTVYRVKRDYPEANTSVSADISMTPKECIPIGENMVQNTPDIHLIVNVIYANVTLGIKDPSVFDVPEICKQDINSSRSLKEPNNPRSQFLPWFLSSGRQ
ncbi:ependymin-related protein 1-like [Glandiceps talaboti]